MPLEGSVFDQNSSFVFIETLENIVGITIDCRWNRCGRFSLFYTQVLSQLKGLSL